MVKKREKQLDKISSNYNIYEIIENKILDLGIKLISGIFLCSKSSPDSILQSLVKLEYIDKLIILESGHNF
jgi:hypothetical protein